MSLSRFDCPQGHDSIYHPLNSAGGFGMDVPKVVTRRRDPIPSPASWVALPKINRDAGSLLRIVLHRHDATGLGLRNLEA